MTQAISMNSLLRRLAVLTVVVISSVIIAACAAPAATPSMPTQAPAAVEAPTGAPVSTDAPAAGAGGMVSFSKDVSPILVRSCIQCHGGADGKKGDLDLRTHESVMKGGKNGQIIVPGDAPNSMLVKLINEGKMPKRAPKLAQEQIDLIAKWVSEGALSD